MSKGRKNKEQPFNVEDNKGKYFVNYDGKNIDVADLQKNGAVTFLNEQEMQDYSNRFAFGSFDKKDKKYDEYLDRTFNKYLYEVEKNNSTSTQYDRTQEKLLTQQTPLVDPVVTDYQLDANGNIVIDQTKFDKNGTTQNGTLAKNDKGLYYVVNVNETNQPSNVVKPTYKGGGYAIPRYDTGGNAIYEQELYDKFGNLLDPKTGKAVSGGQGTGDAATTLGGAKNGGMANMMGGAGGGLFGALSSAVAPTITQGISGGQVDAAGMMSGLASNIPIVGGLISGVINGFSEKEKRKEKEKMVRDQQITQDKAYLNQYPTQGTNFSSYFDYGGMAVPKEMQQTMQPIQGGKIVPTVTGENEGVIVGRQHSSGGVKIDTGGGNIIEAQGGETTDGNKIFSDTLKMPGTKETFAEQHAKLLENKQKVMKKYVDRKENINDRIIDPIIKDTFDKEMMNIEVQIEKLFKVQQTMNGDYGANNQPMDNTGMFKKGGMANCYVDGGKVLHQSSTNSSAGDIIKKQEQKRKYQEWYNKNMGSMTEEPTRKQYEINGVPQYPNGGEVDLITSPIQNLAWRTNNTGPLLNQPDYLFREKENPIQMEQNTVKNISSNPNERTPNSPVTMYNPTTKDVMDSINDIINKNTLDRSHTPVPKVTGIEPPNVNDNNAPTNNKGNGFANIAPYVDNMFNLAATLSSPKVPIPNKIGAAPLNTKFDINDQLAAIDRVNRGSKEDINKNTSSSAIARANNMAVDVNTMSAKNSAYTTKENTENQLENQKMLNDQSISAHNFANIDRYNQDVALRQKGILSSLSSNVANAVSDYGQQQAEKNMSDLDKQKWQILSKQFRDTGVVPANLQDTQFLKDVYKQYPTMLEGDIKDLKRTGRDTGSAIKLYNELNGTNKTEKDF